MSLHSAAVLIAHLALAGVGLWLVVIDARTHRLPNRIVLPTLGALIVLAVVESLTTGDAARMLRALLGGLVLGFFYAVIHVASRQGMGGGDVKLAAVIGLVLAWHGWWTLLLGSAAAFVLGALYAITLLLMGKVERTTRIAFGPWMILGAVLAIAVT